MKRKKDITLNISKNCTKILNQRIDVIEEHD